MRQQVGCAYVSLAPPGLLRLCEEGAPAVLSGWMEQWGKPVRTAQRVWVADELACQSLREVLELIDDGQLTPPPEANEKLELTQQYLEYVNWARDAETGLRWGFPGESMWPEEKEAPVPPAVRWGVVPEMRLPDEKMPRGADPVEWMRKRLIAEEVEVGEEMEARSRPGRLLDQSPARPARLGCAGVQGDRHQGGGARLTVTLQPSPNPDPTPNSNPTPNPES